MGRDEFDIVVVGAGAAGCVLARRLAESGDRSVLLLEAGPDLRRKTPAGFHDGWRLPSIPDWGFESEPDTTGATGMLRRGRLLGGTSWLTRFAVRCAASDFAAWAAGGNAGWSFEDVLPAFRRVETDADFGGDPWHGDRGPMPITRYLDLQPSEIHGAALAAFDSLGFPRVEDHNAAEAIGAGRMPMSSRAGWRVTALDACLPLEWRSPRLTVRSDSVVARVLLEAGRAAGVQLIDGTRHSGADPALDRDVPELRRADGKQSRHDVLGQRSDRGGPSLLPRSRPSASDGTRIGPPQIGRSHPPAAHRAARSARTGGRRSARRGIPARPGARESTRGPADHLRSLGVDVRVDLAGVGANLADHPGVDLPSGWRGSEIRRLCTDAPPPDPGDQAAVRRHVIENAYSIPHVVGTCAMGPSPDEGAVVDALGRVHGVDRLAVVDASIIPDPPSGFPHIITIMIAEHLAERLARVL